MNVGIILVNYQAVEATRQCLTSLMLTLVHTPANCRIWVIENGSADDSLKQLRDIVKTIDLPITLIHSSQNLGYCGGNNLGMAEAMGWGADYIWLLNNDALAEPDTLTYLLAQALKSPQALIGSQVNYLDNRYQQTGTRVCLWTGHSRGMLPDEAYDGMTVDSLTGACLFIPRIVVERIGLLDEGLFLYYDDVEYCLRARKAGFRCRISTQAVIRHHLGCATDAIPDKRRYYYQRNRFSVCWQYANPLQRLTLVGYTAFRWFRSRILALLQQNPAHGVFTLAICDAWKGRHGPCPHPLI